jgi:hypothetical protein
MKPIMFQCHRVIPRPADVICLEIADVTRWSEFKGYGVLPGVENARYEKRSDDMIGSRIRVRNSDGSEHVEVIYKWVLGEEVAMKFHDFTPPLSYLATHFTEEWNLKATSNGTHVTRTFRLYPSQRATRPLLWLISLLLRQAIRQHLENISTISEKRG